MLPEIPFAALCDAMLDLCNPLPALILTFLLGYFIMSNTKNPFLRLLTPVYPCIAPVRERWFYSTRPHYFALPTLLCIGIGFLLAWAVVEHKLDDWLKPF